MTYRGAVFFDYDGTITDEKAGVHLPTEKTLAAFEALRKNGYLVVLATGRAIPYARHVLGYFDGVVTSNGTFSMVRQEVVADHPIEAPLLRELVDALDGYGVFYGIDNPEVCYAKDKQAPCFAAWLHAFKIPAEAFVNLPSGPLPAGYKVSVVFENAGQLEAMRARFGGLFAFDMHRQALSGDITHRGFHKGVGVRDIITYFHVPEAETYAFGDGANDVGMLQAVRCGVAMQEHAEELLPHAAFVTKSVADEGIYEGLRQLGLL